MEIHDFASITSVALLGWIGAELRGIKSKLDGHAERIAVLETTERVRADSKVALLLIAGTVLGTIACVAAGAGAAGAAAGGLVAGPEGALIGGAGALLGSFWTSICGWLSSLFAHADRAQEVAENVDRNGPTWLSSVALVAGVLLLVVLVRRHLIPILGILRARLGPLLKRARPRP